MLEYFLKGLVFFVLIAFWGWLAWSWFALGVETNYFRAYLNERRTFKLMDSPDRHARVVSYGVVVTLIIVLCGGFMTLFVWLSRSISLFVDLPENEFYFLSGDGPGFFPSLGIIAGLVATLRVCEAFDDFASLCGLKDFFDHELSYMAGIVESIESFDVEQLVEAEESLEYWLRYPLARLPRPLTDRKLVELVAPSERERHERQASRPPFSYPKRFGGYYVNALDSQEKSRRCIYAHLLCAVKNRLGKEYDPGDLESADGEGFEMG